jgi:hypothetical protein
MLFTSWRSTVRLAQVDHIEAQVPGGIARQHHQQISQAAVRHDELAAAQHAVGERGLDRLRRQRRALLDHRERALQFARRDRRQQCRPLRLGARAQQRLGHQIDRGAERRRRERGAELLGHQAEFEIARAGAAVLLRDRGADQAHFGQARPHRLGIGRAPFQHRAHLVHAAALGEKPRGLVAQQLLVV